jgi:hypothetical protein
MKHYRALLLSTLIVPLLAAATSPADTLAFRPEPGSRVTRAWNVKQELTLDDMQMFVGGQPMSFQMDMSTSMENKIEVSDVFLSLRDGAPKELRRTFDKLATSGEMEMEAPMMGGPTQTTVEGTSELEGKTVRFTWNEEKSAYDREYHESEGEAEMLEGLEEDMDIRSVLPGKEVAVGDTWEIDVKKLRTLLAPGGDVGIRPEEPAEGEGKGGMPGMDNMGDLNQMLGEMLEGKATAEYKGIEEKDGAKYGVIALTIEVQSSNDMADLVAESMKEMPEEMGSFEIDHMDVEFKMNADGRLLWDVASGHIGGVDLSGDVEMEMDMGMKIQAQGNNTAVEQTMSMSGTISIQLAVTRG